MPQSTALYVAGFSRLGGVLKQVAAALEHDDPSMLQSTAAAGLFDAAVRAEHKNPWFTRGSVVRSLAALSYMLRPEALGRWLSAYGTGATDPSPEPSAGGTGSAGNTRRQAYGTESQAVGYGTDGGNTRRQAYGTFDGDPQPGSGRVAARVLVIMAGNLPLVGFHDMLCVLVSGHRLLAKPSSQDDELPAAMGRLICETVPALAGSIGFAEGPAKDFDAVIATGSDNTSRYFDYYFGNYPHIIRKNRTSLAVLTGRETQQELTALGNDVFAYFGRGCRNVSMLWIPQGFDMQRLVAAWKGYGSLTLHNKYMNNYDYQKAVMLVNRIPFTDTGFCLLREENQLHSPVAVVHYQRYQSIDEVAAYNREHHHRIQCVVGRSEIFGESDGTGSAGSADQITPVAFGAGQSPEPWDYADGVDTMRFLHQI